MIPFEKIDLSRKDEYNAYLFHCGERGCGYSLANLRLWGRQRVAFLDDALVLFSQFDRSSVYPFPIIRGDARPVLDAIVHDARKRGLQCRLTAMTAADCATLEELYPGQFRFQPDRDGCDYVYDINALADLPGRKYQRKRNHANRFWQNHPNCQILPLDESTEDATQAMLRDWYASRPELTSTAHMEQVALRRAFEHREELGLEGLVLMENGRVLAMTMGSFLCENTVDVHFEKASEDGAYAAINQAFAAHLREKYPQLKFLNREDDLGLPGLRKAKLSYYPHHLVVKFWAALLEDDDEH